MMTSNLSVLKKRTKALVIFIKFGNCYQKVQTERTMNIQEQQNTIKLPSRANPQSSDQDHPKKESRVHDLGVKDLHGLYHSRHPDAVLCITRGPFIAVTTPDNNYTLTPSHTAHTAHTASPTTWDTVPAVFINTHHWGQTVARLLTEHSSV